MPVMLKETIAAPAASAGRPSADEKKVPVATDLELVPSEKEGEVDVISEGDYTPEQYKKVLRKIGACSTFATISIAY